jgi:uncharacterized protein (DUF111 family)
MLVLDCTAGCAGDMLLAALIDLGVPLTTLEAGLRCLGLDFRLELSQVQRRGSAALALEVLSSEVEPPLRKLEDIDAILDRAAGGLPAEVVGVARDCFRTLGEVEAEVHGVALEEVHFHEVGAIDTMVDIVGVCLGFHLLGERPRLTGTVGIALGGTIHLGSHGTLPLPVPATKGIIERFGLPTAPVPGPEVERLTPTGAVLVATLADYSSEAVEVPVGSALRSGRGAGSRDPDGPPNMIVIHEVEG